MLLLHVVPRCKKSVIPFKHAVLCSENIVNLGSNYHLLLCHLLSSIPRSSQRSSCLSLLAPTIPKTKRRMMQLPAATFPHSSRVECSSDGNDHVIKPLVQWGRQYVVDCAAKTKSCASSTKLIVINSLVFVVIVHIWHST